MLRKALAAYRLTYLFVHEDGPFSIFDWIRHKVGIVVEIKRVITHVHDDGSVEFDQQKIVHVDGFWAELLICPLCLSVWFAALVHFLPDFIVDWLSVAGICLLLFERDE